MSARDFYQTFYQTDSLFRLADESWTTLVPVAEVVSETIFKQEPDLLAELDSLSEQLTVTVLQPQAKEVLVDSVQSDSVQSDSVQSDSIQSDSIQSESLSTESILVEPAQAGPVVIAAPEPLPQPAPRPKTPSILPPIQQPRLPQLNHKVLLLADEELDPSNLLFLEKILRAVNLNVNGVDLLNLHGAKDLDFAELLRGKYVHHFITFGVPFERINLDIMMDRYAPVRFEGITFLMADSLPTIEADQNLKKRLWGALQRVFLQR